MVREKKRTKKKRNKKKRRKEKRKEKLNPTRRLLPGRNLEILERSRGKDNPPIHYCLPSPNFLLLPQALVLAGFRSSLTEVPREVQFYLFSHYEQDPELLI